MPERNPHSEILAGVELPGIPDYPAQPTPEDEARNEQLDILWSAAMGRLERSDAKGGG